MASDLRDQLQQSLGSAYTLERELGGGGMSRVFVALEVRLGRRVVVKVLSPDLAAGVNADRFEREIRLVASLQQANIVPLLSAGDMDGLPYYTMPLVEGRSLGEHLERAGSLPVADAVGILRDVARALSYAHERGVVHRDIKPANVLLSGRAAVVADFGIAKALSASRTGTSSATLTQAGFGVGTPAYMAPEQVSGDPGLDHRADLYAFGCLAFELLAGRPPFEGLSVHRVLASHLAETPRPVTELRPDAPPALAALIARCLEKDPDRRPQSAGELLHTLEVISAADVSAVPARMSRRPVLFVAVALVVAGAVGTYTAIRGGRGTTPEGAAGMPSLAVLPFVNTAGDTAHDYRADGLTDALQIELRKVPGISVVARAAANRFREQPEIDAREVGRVLGVGFVLHGTFRTAGTRQKVFARLINTADGEELWADAFEHELSDVFAAEDDIRDRILAILQQRFAGAGVVAAGTLPGPSSRGTADPAAYELYERGRFLMARRGPGVALAARYFEQAIARDPSFARAHAGLSTALELLPNFVDTAFVAVYAQATTAARRALALDSTLAEAHASLALAYMQSYRWAQANAEFQRALQLDPGDASVRLLYARYLTYTGQLPQAVAELERAKALDPTSGPISGWLANNLARVGRRAEAFAEIDRTLELDSMNVPMVFFGASLEVQRGRIERARALLARVPPIPPWLGAAARVYGAMGDRETGLRLLHRLEAERGWPGYRHTSLATAALAVGDTARALDELERATEAREFWPASAIFFDPQMDALRQMPRFAALVRRVGLDVGLSTSPSGRGPP